MANKFYKGIDLRGQRAINASDPAAATDLATKQYVDNTTQGLANLKDPVKGTTTGTLALNALVNGLVHDGVTYATGDRILLKNQSNLVENGIYSISAAGSGQRTTDADTGLEVEGMSVTVLQGTTKGTGSPTANPVTYVMNALGPVTIGTTSITFTAVGSSPVPYTAGAGLGISGTDFSVGAGNGIVVDPDSVRVDPAVVVRKYSANCVASTNPQTFTHGLGTDDVDVSVWEGTEQVYPDITRTSGAVIIDWGGPPTASQYRVVVHG